MEFFGIANPAKLCFYDLTTGKLALYMPTPNAFSMSVTGEVKEALAGGVSAIQWQANRKATAKIDSQLISSKLLTIMLGAVETTEASGTFAQYETGKIDSSTATFNLTNAVSVGTLSVFLTENDGKTVKTELTLAAGSTPGATEYKISGQQLTFDASNKGKPVLCIYAKDGVNITRQSIKADVYSKAYKIQALGGARLESGVDKLVEITLPKATAQSNMDITFDASSPSQFSFTLDLAADPVTQELIVMRYL